MNEVKQNLNKQKTEASEMRTPDFNALVREYSQPLYWHLKRLIIDHEDCNDLLQDTLIKAWKNLDRFRGDSEIYTWLYRIATNEALNFLKKRKRRFTASENESIEFQLANLEADPYFNGDEIQKQLQKAIFELPAKQQAVFNMKYFEGMKYDQMAKILDTSVGALKASYHHAVKKIEAYFKAEH